MLLRGHALPARVIRKEGFRNVLQRCGLRAPPVIAQQIACDPEQIPSCRYVLIRRLICAEKTHIGFLHKIFGQGGVARAAKEIGPQWPRGPLIKSRKLRAIHGRRGDGNRRGVSLQNDLVPAHRDIPGRFLHLNHSLLIPVRDGNEA